MQSTMHTKERMDRCEKIYATGDAQKDGLESFWEKACKEADIPCLVPNERWAIEKVYSPDVIVNRMYVRFAGFLPNVEAFDAALFR